MMKIFPIKHFFQFIKFSIVGVINTALDFGIFTLLNYFLGEELYRISQIVSYSCAVINSYYLNKSWTFQSGRNFNFIEIVKFLLVNLVSLGISLYFLFLFHEKLSMNILLSKGCATFFSVIVNFTGNKFWVFKKRLNGKKSPGKQIKKSNI